MQRDVNALSVAGLGEAFAKSAGPIHDELMKGSADLNLSNPRPTGYYLDRLKDMGVIDEAQSRLLSEMIEIVRDESKPMNNSRLADLGKQIAGQSSEVATAIAGIVEASTKNASTPILRSIAGDDVIGAVVGGVSGAVAGAMVGGKVGAAFGGAFGAVLGGGLASMQAAEG